MVVFHCIFNKNKKQYLDIYSLFLIEIIYRMESWKPHPCRIKYSRMELITWVHVIKLYLPLFYFIIGYENRIVPLILTKRYIYTRKDFFNLSCCL